MLDGLRGVAAIAVLIFHIGQATHSVRLAPFGFLAVDLFFMMSGFVIARSYEPRFSRDLTWRRFAAVRVARLYPALALGVLAAAILPIRRDAGAVLPQVLRSLLLIPDLSAPTLFPLNPVLWSLFYELALNLVHAILAPRFTSARVAIGTGICGAAFLLASWAYHGTGIGWDGHSFLAGFARAGWGYGVGLTLARLPITLSRRAAWATLVGATMLLVAPAVGFTPLRLLASLFLVFPLAVAAAVQVDAPHVVERATEYLGGLSYPLYTIHIPLLGLAAMLPWAGPSYPVAMVIGVPLIAAGVEWGYDAPLRVILKRVLARGADGRARSANI